MTNEELLAEAKRRYPVGTQFKVAHIPSDRCIVLSHNKHSHEINITKTGLYINLLVTETKGNCDAASVYFNGKWAEIISLPKDIKYDYVIF